jgi:hypothetical protein
MPPLGLVPELRRHSAPRQITFAPEPRRPAPKLPTLRPSRLSHHRSAREKKQESKTRVDENGSRPREGRGNKKKEKRKGKGKGKEKKKKK